MSRIGGLGTIGRYGPVQQQDTTGAANPTLQPDPRYSGVNGIGPMDPRYYGLQAAQNNPMVNKAFLRAPTQTPAPTQTGANPQYSAAMHAQQIADTSGRMTAAAKQWRQQQVNGGRGAFAIGPNGHALAPGSNVGQNGFGAVPGMAGSGMSNADKDMRQIGGGVGGLAGGGGYGPIGGGAVGGAGGGGMHAMGSAFGGSVGAGLQGAYNSANGANQQRYDQLLGLSGQLSDAQMTREGQRKNMELGRVNQEMVSSGLAGTTIMPNLERGVVDDSALRENEISDAGTRSKMGIIERRTDQGPDAGLVAGLASRPGAAGGGGYGLGGGSAYGPMASGAMQAQQPTFQQPQQGPMQQQPTENDKMAQWLNQQRAINQRNAQRGQQLASIQRSQQTSNPALEPGGMATGSFPGQDLMSDPLNGAADWAAGGMSGGGYGPLSFDPLLYNPDLYNGAF